MKHLIALILVTIFATASCVTATFADDAPVKGKKGKSQWQVMKLKKLLEPVTLTAEQETGFAEVLKTYTAQITELEGKGLTKEKLKARGAKRKEGRESGVKGKELLAFINEGLSEEDLSMFQDLEKATKTAETAVAKMLTDEQAGSLPEKVQKRMAMLKKQGKGKKGKGKGKKKKKEAE